MEQAFHLLRNVGIGGFITPNKYMVYGYGRRLRDLLLEQCQVTHFVDLARCPSVFPEAATYTAVTIFRKIPPSDLSRIQCIVFEKDTPELLGVVQGPGSIPNTNLHLIPVSRFCDTPQHVISPRLSDDNWQLLVKCRTNAFELGEQFKIEQCIRIGSEKVRREVILDERRLSEISPSERAKVRKVIDAEELTKYAVEWQDRYLLYEPSKLYNPKSQELLDSPKVLVKDTSTHLTVALDTGEWGSSGVSYFYPLNTIYAIVPYYSPSCDVRYLATVLNCPLSDFLYKLLFGALTIGGGFVRFREYLQHLPVRHIVFTTPADKRAQLLENGKQLYERCLSRGNNDCLLGFVEGQLIQTPECADVVHDLLAFLADQMIAMHSKLREEVIGFVAWLERQTGSKVANWRNQEKIKTYHNYDFATLLSVLKRNHREFQEGVNPESRSFQEAVEHEFDLSIERLMPLKARLAATERLIELIVYQLYKLTGEEVRMVEASRRDTIYADRPQR